MKYPQRWLKEHNAIISPEGWRRPETKELIKCQKGLIDGGEDDNSFIDDLVTGVKFKNIEIKSKTHFLLEPVNTIELSYTFDTLRDIDDDELEKYGGIDAVVKELLENTSFLSSIPISNLVIDSEEGKITFDVSVTKFTEFKVNVKIKNKISNDLNIVIYEPRQFAYIDDLHSFGSYEDGPLINLIFNVDATIHATDYMANIVDCEIEYNGEGSVTLENITIDRNVCKASIKIENVKHYEKIGYTFIVDGNRSNQGSITYEPYPTP